MVYNSPCINEKVETCFDYVKTFEFVKLGLVEIEHAEY